MSATAGEAGLMPLGLFDLKRRTFRHMRSCLIIGSLAVLLWHPHATGASVPLQRDIALRWSNAALHGIRDSKVGAPVVARVLAIANTCMYDAWAAYNERAVSAQLGVALRRPASERTIANKEKAISYAAYRALADLPVDTNSVYVPLMKQLGYDPNDNSTDIETPAGIGNVACAAVLEFRHHDRANQFGDLAQDPYSDWTGYATANTPSPVPARASPSDPNRFVYPTVRRCLFTLRAKEMNYESSCRPPIWRS